ncbi:MAG TPA: hypothetical protein VF812_12330 [Ktedonobacterales bacterium]
MRIPQSAIDSFTPPESERPSQPYTGHAHFWERMVSRRAVITSAAAGTAVALSSGLLTPGFVEAHATSIAPKPIPETLFPNAPFHVLGPGSQEPSTITDFKGFVGATDIQGHGTGGFLFDADMRFMQGTYIGVDGKLHHGTFGFV